MPPNFGSLGCKLMIIALSIAVGLGAAYILCRVLFYDFSDFFEGCGKFLEKLVRGGRGPSRPLTPEYFEDEGWSNGIRFFLYLAFSCGGACLTYYALRKYFG